MSYLLAHDVGTGGDKAVLVTSEGHLVASAFEPYQTYYPKAHWAEQDPDDWWRAIAAVTRRLLRKNKIKPSEILALTFSPQMLGVLPIDRQTRPLRRCIIWLDGRAGEEARTIMRKVGGPAIFARLFGVALTGKDVLAKLLWLKTHETDVYQRATAILDVGGYLLLRSTGRWLYEWTGASVTGLFDLKRKTWNGSLMRLLKLDPSKFPDLVPSTARVGGLTPEAADEFGLLEGTPVIAGAGDAPSAAMGSGAVSEGAGHIYLGTSGWVGVVTSQRVVGKRGIATIQSADPNKLFLIAETETAGACLEWAARQLYRMDPSQAIYAQMDYDVNTVEPGAQGLIFTPWMYGERCPVADECVRSAFLNLCATHTREHMTRAIFEGVAFNLRWILESIDKLYGIRPDPLRVIGGGARGLPWLQIIADVTGHTIESVPEPQEAGAIGAALVAAVGIEILPTTDIANELIQTEHTMIPSTDHSQVYDELFEAYVQVYGALRRLYHKLNRASTETLR
jgi:xylulokinase